jgi:nicotinate-nucleotide adenylyltransferase
MPALEISSTDLRRRAQQGRSLRFLVPDPVIEYIERHGLYDA